MVAILQYGNRSTYSISGNFQYIDYKVLKYISAKPLACVNYFRVESFCTQNSWAINFVMGYPNTM